MYYSVIGLLAVLVLIIVNRDILIHRGELFGKPVWNLYRKFLFAVLAYYITDILWGFLESRKLAGLLFADTTVYFIAMSVGIIFWVEFTVAYLEEKDTFGKVLITIGRIVAGLITALVIINIFTPVLFEIGDDCTYTALPFRYVMLTVQILLLLLISVHAVVAMIRMGNKSGNYYRYQILASFGVIMAVLLFVQLWFPLLPLYSIGYMLGSCMLHSFVAADEKENFKREQEETEKITELKDRFASLLYNMPGMAFTKDAETGVYLTCNRYFAEYAQKETPEDVVGLTDAEIFDAETAAHFVRDDKIALSLGKPYVFYEEVFDATGNQRQLQTTKIKYIDTAGRSCVLGMCQDVTDLVHIRHENAMTKEAYESAVSSGIIYTNIAQTLAREYIDLYYVDTDTEEFIEYRQNGREGGLSEVRRGWHFFSDCKNELADNVYDEDRELFLKAMNRKMLMKALDREDDFVMTFRGKADKGYAYVSMRISRMQDEKYIIMGIADVDAEIRETKAKNEALIKALALAEDANREKEALLFGRSHEIRTPINAIIGLDTLALKNTELDTQTRLYLEKIGYSANSLLSIINGILGTGEKDKGTGETSESADTDMMTDDELSASDLTTEINLDALHVLVVDDDPIEAEYSKTILRDAGIRTDSCTSGHEALHKIEIQHAGLTPYNVVLMDWNMPGMSGSEASAEIHELYRKETTVVALTAFNWEDIREEAHKVGVESFLAKPLLASGITESFDRIARKNRMNIFKEKKKANLSGRRLLIAEDIDINVEILEDLLDLENIKVDHAANGKIAVELFEKSTAGIYAAILMDVRMPVMNGLEAAAAIRAMEREDAKKIPIIALTANAFDEDIRQSLQAGMNAHMTKPIDIDHLLKVLGELVYEAES